MSDSWFGIYDVWVDIPAVHDKDTAEYHVAHALRRAMMDEGLDVNGSVKLVSRDPDGTMTTPKWEDHHLCHFSVSLNLSSGFDDNKAETLLATAVAHYFNKLGSPGNAGATLVQKIPSAFSKIASVVTGR